MSVGRHAARVPPAPRSDVAERFRRASAAGMHRRRWHRLRRPQPVLGRRSVGRRPRRRTTEQSGPPSTRRPPPPAPAPGRAGGGARPRGRRLRAGRGRGRPLITTEAGICRKQARHEVRRAVAALRAAADQARRLGADRLGRAPTACPARPPTAAAELHVVPEPVALAVAITPFNHPLNQVVHKVAPAVAAGAPVVLKPSEKAPLSALRLAEVPGRAASPRTPSPSSPAGRRRPWSRRSSPATRGSSW